MGSKPIFLAVIVLCVGPGMFAADKRPLTVEDAVSTRRIAVGIIRNEVVLSPNGLEVAYIVKAPDIQKNSNNYELYVRDVTQTARPGNGRLLFHSDHLAGIQWLGNGKQVGIISTETRNQFREDMLNLIDIVSGTREVIESPKKRILSFSVDATGDHIAFAAAKPREMDPAVRQARKRYGFRVSPGEPINSNNESNDSYLYMADREPNGERKVTRLQPLGPSGKQVEVFNGEIAVLSLSPDGRFLLFRYETDEIPDSWKGSFYGQELRSIPYPPPIWGLVSFESNQFRVAFDAPAYTYVPPVWSDDSQAFALSAFPPEGSSWEKRDFAEGFVHLGQLDSYLHLFGVDVRTLSVLEVQRRYTGVGGGNISWNQRNHMSVPLDGGILAGFDRSPDGWKEVSRKTIFAEPGVILQSISNNGEIAIGVLEEITTPPDLVIRNLQTYETYALTELNPQYRDIARGEVEKINWVNKFGVQCWGYLIKPVGYDKTAKYPLVIMNNSSPHFFVSDGSYTTAFPPQPLASNGFAILMVEYAFDFNELPKGFPGRLAEAYNWMALVESGVDYLVDRGVVDRSKVGIIGFSRTSWKTDFMLTHSDFKFAAASSADSGLYNYGSYWFSNHAGQMANDDQMMGGPPYGKTMENWLKYAPAFNAQRVNCPILMEYTGSGNMPYGPTHAYEFFTALYRQEKPVELYFYPLGDHPLDTPSERVASLQRNVDWFRFWLKGEEDPDPAKAEQYARWRELRKLQEQNEKKPASESVPTSPDDFRTPGPKLHASGLE